MTEGRIQVWRVLQAVVALLVFGVLLLSVQELLNPFLFFWILVLVLLPFRGMPGRPPMHHRWRRWWPSKAGLPRDFVARETLL